MNEPNDAYHDRHCTCADCARYPAMEPGEGYDRRAHNGDPWCACEECRQARLRPLGIDWNAAEASLEEIGT